MQGKVTNIGIGGDEKIVIKRLTTLDNSQEPMVREVLLPQEEQLTLWNRTELVGISKSEPVAMEFSITLHVNNVAPSGESFEPAYCECCGQEVRP